MLAQQVNRFWNGHLLKPHLVARAQLANMVHVGCDHVRDFGIATGRLLIDKQNNRLPVLRHLDGAERDAVG